MTNGIGVPSFDGRACVHLAPELLLATAVEAFEPDIVCERCCAEGRTWEGLLVCLRCGLVGCDDASPARHARDHYTEVDHPLALHPPLCPEPTGAVDGYCFVDELWLRVPTALLGRL